MNIIVFENGIRCDGCQRLVCHIYLKLVRTYITGNNIELFDIAVVFFYRLLKITQILGTKIPCVTQYISLPFTRSVSLKHI